MKHFDFPDLGVKKKIMGTDDINIILKDIQENM